MSSRSVTAVLPPSTSAHPSGAPSSMPRLTVPVASECPLNRQIAAYILGIAESPSSNPRRTQPRPPDGADGTILVNDGLKATAIHGGGDQWRLLGNLAQEGLDEDLFDWLGMAARGSGARRARFALAARR